MITSTSNPQVKNLQQLGRKAKLRNEQDVFLVEGTKMYLEAPAERIRKVYLSQSLYEEKGESFVKGHDVEILEDRVFAAACDTKTPQGVLCMVPVRRPVEEKESIADDPGKSAGSGKSGDNSADSRRCRCRWCDPEQGVCGYLQS